MKDIFVTINFEIKDNKIKGLIYSPADISEEEMLIILKSLVKGCEEKRLTEFLLQEAKSIINHKEF